MFLSCNFKLHYLALLPWYEYHFGLCMSMVGVFAVRLLKSVPLQVAFCFESFLQSMLYSSLRLSVLIGFDFLMYVGGGVL